jgi:hypothetical protein
MYPQGTLTTKVKKATGATILRRDPLRKRENMWSWKKPVIMIQYKIIK